jgi:hypothetical protein
MERGYLKYVSIDEKITLKWIFKKWDKAWPGLIWLRTGTCGRLL